MGMTMIEKILARATGRAAVKAGDVVEPRVDLAMSHENAALVLHQFHEIYKDTVSQAKGLGPGQSRHYLRPSRPRRERQGRDESPVLLSETPQYAFADEVEFRGQLQKGEVPAGSIVIAGMNFGCASSREQAASCLKGHELVVVAHHFARIFLQNSINVGLRTVICPDIEANEGDDLEVTPEVVINKTSGRSFDVTPMPQARQSIIDAGGLIPYTRRLLVERERT
jgi:3-isopropylmalate/(R)-2-methylmalate dehydratase small subunit